MPPVLVLVLSLGASSPLSSLPAPWSLWLQVLPETQGTPKSLSVEVESNPDAMSSL